MLLLAIILSIGLNLTQSFARRRIHNAYSKERITTSGQKKKK